MKIRSKIPTKKISLKMKIKRINQLKNPKRKKSRNRLPKN